jgi:hypothetical protein
MTPQPPTSWRVIVAGSRSGFEYADVVAAILASRWSFTEVVSGGARGVDTHGENWAWQWGVPVRRFNADWDRHGKVAGRLRNVEMAEYADALIACWDGRSTGTAHMVQAMRYRAKPVFLVQL